MSKSPSLRRIQADIRELAFDPSDQYCAAPLENDMFEWHFTIRGAEETDFEGGLYHGRILLPAEYPYKPPHIIFLTKSGRFEINTKVCLSFSAYHPELWQPAWGIRLILEALISFLPTKGDGAIGSLDWSPHERRRLATESHKYSCPQCGPIVKLLPLFTPEEKKKKNKQLMESNSNKKKTGGTFAKEIAELQRLQQMTEQGRTNNNNKSKEKKKKEDKENTPMITPTPTTSSSNTATAMKKNEEEQNEDKDKDVVVSEETKKKELSSSLSSSSSPAATVVEEHKNNSTTTSAAAATVATGGGGTTTGLELEMDNDNGGVNVNNNNTTTTTTTISWMYDPLLNITILLMCVMIVLFAKKGWDLSYELQELRKLPIVDTVSKAAATAAASMGGESSGGAAAAASSEEL